MPSINLRLSEQQHAELEVWANDGHRSLQKEIIWRLFSAEGHYAPKIAPATDEPRVGIEMPPDGTLVTLPASRGCPMQTPAGTKCKVCGKVHPL